MNPITEAVNQACFIHQLTIYYGHKYARVSNLLAEADLCRLSEDLWEVDDGERVSVVNETALVKYLSRGLSWE